MKIKYSVVIPTRNRSQYLPYAIESVLKSSRQDIELIVSNNFSTDRTAEILSNFSDSRLKIIHPEEPLSMSGHYEFATKYAVGEWLTIIGDDDALMPYTFKSLDSYILNYSDIDIISSSRAYYFWEGCEDLYGKTVVSYKAQFECKKRSTKNDLLIALLGIRNCFDIPQLYTTGFIKRSLYNEIKSKSQGFFYHSIIPDIYSAIALCFSRNSYLRVEEPLFWTGTSQKSYSRLNRIYLDSEASNNNYKNTRSLKLSDKIPFYLHSAGFGPIYIFECLNQCSFVKSTYTNRFIRTLVLAATYNSLNKKKQKSQIIKEIFLECNKYKINKIYLFFFSFIIFFLNIVNKIYLVLKNKRVKKKSNVIEFYSEDRKKFFNISEASFFILKLHSRIIKP
jgi:glycosyltransferase involved in cell wall biosynthesis